MFMNPDEDPNDPNRKMESFTRPAPRPAAPTLGSVGRPPSMSAPLGPAQPAPDDLAPRLGEMAGQVAGRMAGDGGMDSGPVAPPKPGISFDPSMRQLGVQPGGIKAAIDESSGGGITGSVRPGVPDFMGRLQQSMRGNLGTPPPYTPRAFRRRRKPVMPGGGGPANPQSGY